MADLLLAVAIAAIWVRELMRVCFLLWGSEELLFWGSEIVVRRRLGGTVREKRLLVADVSCFVSNAKKYPRRNGSVVRNFAAFRLNDGGVVRLDSEISFKEEVLLRELIGQVLNGGVLA